MELMTLEELPMYNVDLEPNLPDIVKEYKNKIRSCEGVIIITQSTIIPYPGY